MTDREEQRAKWRESYWKNRAKKLVQMRASHAKYRDTRLAKRRAKYSANAEKHWKIDKARWTGTRQEKGNMRRAERLRMERYQTPWRPLLKSAKDRAMRKQVPFALTEEWAKTHWTGRCAMTGIEFRVGLPKNGPKFFSPSIDRIVPKLGYVPDNCRFILWAVNAMKYDGTDQDIFDLAAAILAKRPHL